jgi:S-phase kinase-associated protein 1
MSELAATAPPSIGSCKLVSQEGEAFEIPIEVAQLSGLVKNVLTGEADAGENVDMPEIPLPQVNTIILQKMIDFLKHYHEQPMDEIDRVS